MVRRPRHAVVIALVVVIPIVAAVLVVQAVIGRFGAWPVSDVLGWSVLLVFIGVGFLVVRSGGGLRGAVLAAIVVAEFFSLVPAAFIATGVFPARTAITPRLQWTTVVYGALGQAIFSVPLGLLGGLLYRFTRRSP